ncbi:hypothetical protein [uncultured Thiohalocapsa sp.]|uniref:hypothetical protein n=1 Tax=uncultured Thiohalocapsa sp. TaxID=768990 RepID=UPI0025CCFC1A|nr:hypothetical protein [uncultured Thiohalocapsa sp.]
MGRSQRTVLNLGRHFEVPQAQWPALAQRIEALVGGQTELFVADLELRGVEVKTRSPAQVAEQFTDYRGPQLHRAPCRTSGFTAGYSPSSKSFAALICAAR